MEIEVDGAPNQQIASPDEASDNVMYFRTIMKSPVRKASTVVRSKEAGQKAVHLVVSSKESCLEVIKDSAHELIHLFDENVFGTIWDLKAISVEHVTSARLPDAFQGMDSGQDLVLVTSDSGRLLVLHVDLARCHFQKVNEVFLPRAAKSKSLWVDMSSDFEEHRAYGHRISVAPTGSAVVISALEDRMCILPLSKRLENKGQIFDAEMDAVVQQLVAKVIPVPGGKLGAIADLQFTHNDESGDNILHFAALVLRKGKGGFSSVLLFKANLESRTCFLMRSFNTQFCLTTFVSSVSASDQILLGGEGGILLLDTSSASNYPNIGSEGMLATDMEISLSERRIPPLNELGGPNTLVTCIHVADCKEHHGNIKQREIILISTEEGKIWVAEIFQKASFEVKLLGSIDSPIVPSNIVSILGQGGYRRFLVNGDNGDSAVMMMRLNGNEIEIETLERLTMLGVTTDFTVLSDKNVNGGDEFDVLVCSGTGKHASIRRLRYGLPVETHVRSEKGLCDGIVGLYTITFEQKHDQSFLFMAFTTGCRVLTVGSELSDVTDDLGLNPTALTLHAAANSDGHLIQVSDEEVIVIQQPVLDSMDLDVIPCSQPERAVWRPAESTKISVSASLGNLVMCCTCGGTSIHILDTTRDQGSAGEFQIRGEITSFRSSEEVSCMAMTSLGAHGSETRKISIIGTYADALKARAGKIKIYSLGEEKREVELAQSIDLGIYSGSDLSGSVPQSFGILPEPAGGVFLVVGLRNGKVIIFTLNALSLPLVGLGTTRRLAESPITFVSITSYAGPSLIALVEDVAFLVTPSRASLQFQRIGFQPGGISHAAPFICDACPLGMAIVVDGQLKLVSIDRCEKLDVKTIPLALESEHTESESKLEDNFMPARVVWHPDAKLVIVGCNYSRKVCGAEEEPENKVMCCELRLIDHVSWSTVHVQHIGENERIHALALYRTLEDEVLVCVGTGPEISLVSKAQREVESTSLFEKRSASLNENESERSSDSDNEDQGVGDESPTGNETNLKRRRRESKVNSRLLIWRIVQKSGAPELVLVASISTRNACRAICQYQSCLAVATGETWTLYEFSRVRLEKKERSCNKTRFRRLLSKTARFLITSLTSNGFHLAVGDCVDSFSTWRIAFPVFSWQVISGVTELKSTPEYSHLFMMQNMRATRGYFARLEVRVCTESPQALKLEDCAIDLLVGNGFLPTIDNFTFKFTPTSGGCEFWKETSEGVHFAMVDYHAWGSDEGPPEGTKLKPVYIAIHAKASQSEVKERYKWSFQLCHREPSVNAFRASEEEIELKFAEADSDRWPRTIYIQLPLDKDAQVYMKDTKDDQFELRTTVPAAYRNMFGLLPVNLKGFDALQILIRGDSDLSEIYYTVFATSLCDGAMLQFSYKRELSCVRLWGDVRSRMAVSSTLWGQGKGLLGTDGNGQLFWHRGSGEVEGSENGFAGGNLRSCCEMSLDNKFWNLRDFRMSKKAMLASADRLSLFEDTLNLSSPVALCCSLQGSLGLVMGLRGGQAVNCLLRLQERMQEHARTRPLLGHSHRRFRSSSCRATAILDGDFLLGFLELDKDLQEELCQGVGQTSHTISEVIDAIHHLI